MKKNALSKRADAKDVWNLNDILGGKTFDVLLKELTQKTEAFKNKRNKLNNSISVVEFKNILLLKEDITKLSHKIFAYCELQFFENVSNSKVLGDLSKIKQTLTTISNDTLFFSLWFMHLEDVYANKLMNAKELEKYKYYLYEIRKYKQYTKSEDVEKIINLKSMTGASAIFNIYEILTNSFVYTIGKKEYTFEDVTAWVRSDDPQKRKQAYDLILSKYGENSTILSETYKDIVLDWHNEDMNIRNYKTPLSVRNFSNDIADNAVDTMLKVIRNNVGVFRDYFKLKHGIMQKLGKYPFSRYHLYAPYTLKGTYDYATSKELVLDTYKKFDTRFYEAGKEFFDKKHIHSHPQKHKRSGAFCYSTSNETIPYLMLNHKDRVDDVFTMIHEMGHGIHHIFSSVQTEFTASAPIPLAETASIFSEMILADRMLRESKNNKEKIGILMKLIDDQYASVVRQAYFVIFEIYAHDKIATGITKEELEQQYYALLKEQFGDMEIPDMFKHEWSYITHIYEYPFYCYGYAWGKLLVLALFDMYKKEGKPFVEKYFRLLSYGGSKSPKDILAELGIDPASEKFWQRGFDIIKEEIEELKKLNK
jgi:oligoendopeptidase F